MIERTCESCGTIFSARACEVKRGFGKVCGLKCAGKKGSKVGTYLSGPDHRLYKGGKTARALAFQVWKEKYPERHRAHEIVKTAKKRGKLKPEPCVICASIKVEAHHEDYSKPLEVTWLCRAHHREADKKLGLRTGDFI